MTLRTLPASLRLVASRVKQATAPMTGLGWSVLVTGLVAWVIAGAFAWIEFAYVATACLLLTAFCLLMGLGRSTLAVKLEVEPSRVVLGTPAVGRVSVRNKSSRRTLPLALELPVGSGVLPFNLPSLGTGAEHEEIFVVRTQRRGVIAVGPATTVRGDPIGLVRREVTWTKPIELLVHPRTVALESVGTGILRDLEGQTTNEVSMSDLAFHTLREYVPGDDRRFIHWRSSAKAGRFLVRQFLDTRRLHLAVMVDSDPDSYVDPEDYETAISAAGSLAICSVRAEQETTVLASGQAVAVGTGRQLLDALTRAELDGTGLEKLAARANRIAPGTSLAIMITGPHTTFSQLKHAGISIPYEAKQVALVVDPTQPVGMTSSGGLQVLTLQQLSDLPALIRGSLASQ